MTTPVAESAVENEPHLIARREIRVEGIVQGVGFRPYVYRLAQSLRLAGWVENSGEGVRICVEGCADGVAEFARRLPAEIPPQASISRLVESTCMPLETTAFSIRFSPPDGPKTTRISPDLATCADCECEIQDPTNRRYRYPFTNCTNCGPRYTIIESIPYDRPNTSMKRFTMCPECQAEYDDPRNRRFHAQPNACRVCGPRLALWDKSGQVVNSSDEALRDAVSAIRAGRIVAVKGVGGFHLFADARDDSVVRCLRQRKTRAEKPFALMYPSIEAIRRDCGITDLEQDLILSPSAPIVLVKRRPHPFHALSQFVAPDNPLLGVMRPYSPLHMLIMTELGTPVIATSGNRSDEPIATDEFDALARLDGIADLFLVHDRPIVRPVDDSVVMVIGGRESVLRRGRGYAPFAFELPMDVPPSTALGAHLKNTIVVSNGRNAWLSQHIGDLETPEAFTSFLSTRTALAELHEIKPSVAVCDQHPDYVSTKDALSRGLAVYQVQHHHAHILACLVDNGAEGPVLGIAWDGTGFGSDATIWGGEFLSVDGANFSRVATIHPFRLPGGEAAVREPRRSAIGVLAETLGADWPLYDDLASLRQFDKGRLKTMGRMIERRINSPVTTSVGRLFDAVASILDLCHEATFEGQAAMRLEWAVDDTVPVGAYPFDIYRGQVPDNESVLIADWRPAIRALLAERANGIPATILSTRFHNTLVEMAAKVVQQLGVSRVALSGGCFQNRYLTERMIARLCDDGVDVLWHHRIPPNDGGIAVGQMAALAARQGLSTACQMERGA